jgi:hypothetical protein
MVGAQHVDQSIEAPRILATDVGGIGCEIAGGAVGTDENAILVVSVIARARPDGAL